MTEKSSAFLFCDGASRGNPGRSGWAYLLIASGKVREAGGFVERATNNQMELQALLEAVRYLDSHSIDESSIDVYLDSQLILSGASVWRFAWSKRAWKTKDGEEVKNIQQWKELHDLLTKLEKRISFNWWYIPGHSAYPSNDRVDEMATSFADSEACDLYEGTLKSYPVDFKSGLDGLEHFQVKKASKSSKASSKKAYYLSVIGDQIFRDATWSACEARVKGRRAAKYKKVTDESEERRVLQSWGCENLLSTSS